MCEVKVFVNFDWCSLIAQYLSKWVDTSKLLGCVLKYLNYSLWLKLTKTSPLIGTALKQGQNKFGIRASPFSYWLSPYICASQWAPRPKERFCIIRCMFGVCNIEGHKGPSGLEICVILQDLKVIAKNTKVPWLPLAFIWFQPCKAYQSAFKFTGSVTK